MRKRKWISLIAMAMILTATLIPSVMLYANDTINVTINGQRVNFDDQGPVIVDGRTFVPVRGVFEELGFDVGWSNATQTATLTRGSQEVSITVGDSTFTANGEIRHLDAPARLIGGRTMLPIRAVLESVGYEVDWDDAARTVVVAPHIYSVEESVIGFQGMANEAAGITLSHASAGGTIGGFPHAAAIGRDGSLWTMGTGVGSGMSGGQPPVRIGLDTNWAAISVGGYHTVAIREDGSLWAWGANEVGQVGDGTAITRHFPIRIGNATNWVSVSAGTAHTVAIRDDGSLWAWGHNIFGQLGNNSTNNQRSPVRIGNANDWAYVSAGRHHTMAIRTDGSLWAWGRNGHGSLGDGTGTDRRAPVRIGNENNWRSVSAGENRTAAIRTDGSLWSWGRYNLAISHWTPQRIGNDTNWASVSVGNHHIDAIRADGSLWGTGHLNIGTPERIGNDTNWVSVSSGDGNSVGLRADGSLWAWGNDLNLLFGSNTRHSNYPVRIEFLATLPVSDITGVPTTATAGTNLALTGTVNPSNATNRNITWSIQNVGGTGATISGNTFNAPRAGTVTVRATIVNGRTATQNFTQDFTITVSGSFVPVTSIHGNFTANVATSTPFPLDSSVVGSIFALPHYATNRNITWSVVNAGGTGATIAAGGNILNATRAGTVTVRATVVNGRGIGQDFARDFNLTVIEFIPVTGINSPSLSWGVNVGHNREIHSSVIPANATNRNVTYSVIDPGSAGITIVGNVLSAPFEGTATIRATVANGTATGDFTQDFVLRVTQPEVRQFFQVVGGATPSLSGSMTANPRTQTDVAPGTTVTLTAAPNHGWVFDRWEITPLTAGVGQVSVPDLNSPNASFVMPNGSVQAMAHFRRDEGAAQVFSVRPIFQDETPNLIAWGILANNERVNSLVSFGGGGAYHEPGVMLTASLNYIGGAVASDGSIFDGFIALRPDGSLSNSVLRNPNSTSVTFVMPSYNIRIGTVWRLQ